MASVIEFPAGRSFQFTVHKQFSADPAHPWVNTHWAVSTAPGVLSDLISMGRAITSFEIMMTRTPVLFTEWSVRTGAAESPRTSENFYTEPVNLSGVWGATGLSMLDKRIVLWIAKTATVGRLGKIFLRGSLTEEDIEATAGSIALTTVAAAAIVARVLNAKVYLSPYLVGGGNTILRYCMLKPNGTDIRYINDILLNAVTMAQHNHAYFDRGPNGESVMPETLTLPEGDGYTEGMPEWEWPEEEH